MNTKPHHALSPTPPMGWNSWDCYGATVRESEVRQNADYMKEHLAAFGWQYVVVDIQWSEPNAKSNVYNDFAPLVMDEYSRLMPAENRFPSAAGGVGFRALGDYIHSLGLKFGIHIMRGIPRQAVKAKTAILGTTATAADIADTSSVCSWNKDMFGIDATKPGAQEYYNSIFDLYASWGIDYVKVDDIARPYHDAEVELIRRAIDRTGRPIVLSLSPGAASLAAAAHLADHANLWRLTDDFWDEWKQLREMFDVCRNWQNLRTPGVWPDCDMLTIGKIGIRSLGGARTTNFTPDEQRTHIALWCIFRSPMMVGCELTLNDDFTLSLLTNAGLLEILNHSRDNRELYRDERGAIVWHAVSEDGDAHYVAQFNVADKPLAICTRLAWIGVKSATAVELFTGQTTTLEDTLPSTVPPHGVCIYKLS